MPSDPSTRPEVTDPAAYRAYLAAQLGDRDPLESLAATPRELRALVASIPENVLRRKRSAAVWSPIEIVGHMTDTEWIFGYRTRAILCDDKPVIVAMDQERWVATLRHTDADPRDLVAAFEALRALNLALWNGLTSAQLARVGRHAERGEESLRTLIRMAAGHDRNHMAQIAREAAKSG